MRIAFAYRNLNRSGSLERDSVILLEGLAARGVELHCYCDPGTSVDVDGVVRHDISPLTRSRSRLGFPLLRASFAARATRALRAERSRYELVHVLGVSAWEHDVVHVPAVMAAEQARWPQKAGLGYRAAGARAKLAPLLRPEVGAVRAIERLQFRRAAICARRWSPRRCGTTSSACTTSRPSGSTWSRPRSTWRASPAPRTGVCAASSPSSPTRT